MLIRDSWLCTTVWNVFSDVRGDCRASLTSPVEDETPLDQTGRPDYEVVRQTSFYGIGTEDWLALTIKYCCVLMVKNEEDVAMDILEHVVWSGLFNNRRCEIAIRLATVACAMRMQSHDRIVDNCKRLQQMHQFRSEPLLLMLAALGGGLKQQNAWHNLALQKFLHREVRIYDEAVCGVPLRFNKRHMRWAQIISTGVSRRLGDLAQDEADDGGSAGVSAPDPTLEGEADEDEEGGDGDDDVTERPDAGDQIVPRPRKHSPVFNALYGQNMLTTRSYQSALCKFCNWRLVAEANGKLSLLHARVRGEPVRPVPMLPDCASIPWTSTEPPIGQQELSDCPST